MAASVDSPAAVPVATEFRPHLEKSLVRFGYIRPAVEVTIAENGALLYITSVEGELASAIRDLQHCLYREKIYAETLGLREALIYGVMGK